MANQSVCELLVRAGVLDAASAARVLEVQSRDGGTIGRIAADLGLTTEEAAAGAIAAQLRLSYLDLGGTTPLPESMAGLSGDFCRKHLILPLGMEDRALRLAMVDPLDAATLQDVEFRSSHWVKAVVVTERDLLAALERSFPKLVESIPTYDLLAEEIPEGELEPTAEGEFDVIDPSKMAKDVALPPIVRLVNLILTDAAKAGASDIHIEPQEGHLLVRHRIDGLLQDVLRIPKSMQQATISRLKIISGMDIAERRKPQDGRSRLRVDDRKIDLRVSALPTHHGEKVVVRLLDSGNAHVELGQLGFSEQVLKTFQGLLGRPQGMILVTGPTGSGKTSTLYAALNAIKSPTNNIITVEDPIEYELEGVNQVQINTKAGVTFAAGLRSILRQDPNIVLVGEIRDRETAGIALEASQTGHLLLSTLHTNDAPSSITRLIDLGVEPFLVASSVVGILAQRLVRRICPDCAVEKAPEPAQIEMLGGQAALPAGATWMSGIGCDACRHSGYRGRMAIHELLVVTDEVREQISRRAPDHQIRAAARRSGMRTLVEEGLDKAARGLTTLEEVQRVSPSDSPASGPTRAEMAPAAWPIDRPAVAAEPLSIGSHDGEASPGGKIRVLVVEDSPTVVTVVKYFLEHEGFEVIVAGDGVAGLEMARSQTPAVVVSDLHMPGMDGIELIKALRADPRTRDAAILMLTSESSLESEEAGLSIGADDYLVKPVEPRRLAARVRSTLARARARQARAA